MTTSAEARPYRYLPNLTRLQVAQFRDYGADVPVQLDLYGEELCTAIKEAEGWHWLEVAVAAGYVPHFEGIMQAVRATLIWRGDEARYALATDDDPHGWADTTDLCDLISILEKGVSEMENIIPARPERDFTILSFDRETFDYFFESFRVPEEQTTWLHAQGDDAYMTLALSVAEAMCAEDATLADAIVTGVGSLFRARKEVVS